METTAELVKWLGRLVRVALRGGEGLGNVVLRARVLDAKQVYGQVRLLVKPLEGTGQGWVSVERVTVEG